MDDNDDCNDDGSPKLVSFHHAHTFVDVPEVKQVHEEAWDHDETGPWEGGLRQDHDEGGGVKTWWFQLLSVPAGS